MLLPAPYIFSVRFDIVVLYGLFIWPSIVWSIVVRFNEFVGRIIFLALDIKKGFKFDIDICVYVYMYVNGWIDR